VYVVSGLASGLSVLRLSMVLQFWQSNFFFVSISALLCVLLYSLKARMKFTFLAYVLYCGFKTFIVVLSSFHLVIIFLLFSYILIGAYFFIITSAELDRAAYFPHVHLNDLYQSDFLSINISDKKGEFLGDVSNFDSQSCFVRLKSELKSLDEIIFNFEGNQFFATCRVVARSAEGLGLVLFDNEKAEMKWSDLYRIFKQRGYEKFFRGE